jgi:uncharacterized membrane protein
VSLEVRLMSSVAFACLAAAFWGSSAILVKKGTAEGDLLLGTYVTLFANMAVVLTTNAVTQDLSILLRLSGRFLLFFLTIAVVNYMVGRTLFYQSIRHIGASRAASIEGLEPVFSAVFATLFLRETLSLNVIAGTGFILLGLGLLLTERAAPGKEAQRPAGDSKSLFKGRLFAVLAAIAWGVVPTLVKLGLAPAGAEERVPATVGLLVALMFGIVLYTGFLKVRGALARPYRLSRHGVVLFLSSGAVSSLAQLSYFLSLEVGKAVVVVPIQSTHRLFTLLLSYLLIQHLERVNFRLAVGACFTVLGVVVISMGSV